MDMILLAIYFWNSNHSYLLYAIYELYVLVINLLWQSLLFILCFSILFIGKEIFINN